MNILMVMSRDRSGVEYNLKAFWLMSLQGKVRVNLDGYFPWRTNPSADYKELYLTKGNDSNHLVIVTNRQKTKRIKSSYLSYMDLILNLGKITCTVPRGVGGIPLGWYRDCKDI